MNYRSYADLSRTIVQHIARIPHDIDLVVAVPRSGYLAAGIIALTLNRPLIDVEGFIEGRSPQNGSSRKPFTREGCKHALIVDDSVLSGTSLQKIRARIAKAELGCRISYAAAFVTPQSKKLVDYFFDICPFPRQFEWNVFHHEHLSRCCVMLDGVLGHPSREVTYRDTPRFIIPTYPVRHLIALRQGQTHEDTAAWLAAHGVTYERLTLLDDSASEASGIETLARRKAQLYARDHGAKLFIEEDPAQAGQISHIAGKPVLCTRTQSILHPPPFLVSTIAAKSIQTSRALAKRVWGFLG